MKRPDTSVAQLRLPSVAVLVLIEWTIVMGLYALSWSDRYKLPLGTVFAAFGSVVLGTILGFYIVGAGLHVSAHEAAARARSALASPLAETRLYKALWRLWVATCLIEMAAAGRVPLLQALEGRPSNYKYYGLTSIHGLLLAMGLSLVLIDQAVRLSKRERLIGPRTVVFFGWLILILSRKHMVLALLQLALLVLASGRVRLSARQIVRWAVTLVIVVYAFAEFGVLRSPGAVTIKDKLLYSGPSFVPQAAVWIYAYATTPLANLANAIALGYSGHGLLGANTFTGLIPHFITGSTDAYQTTPWLLTANFNVSTGYVGPLLDGGTLGIVVYALLIGALGGFLRSRSDRLGPLLAYIACIQCTATMLYANNFSNLNNVTQIPVFLLLTAGCVVRRDEQADGAAEAGTGDALPSVNPPPGPLASSSKRSRREVP